jgi:exosortase C (VPDSG-CTERM-specific)
MILETHSESTRSKANDLTYNENTIPPLAAQERRERSLDPAQIKGLAWRCPVFCFLLFSGVLLGLFYRPLIELIAYAWRTSGSSHILLMPFICWYFVRLRSVELLPKIRPGSRFALIPATLACLVLVVSKLPAINNLLPAKTDALTLSIFSFVLFLLAGAFWFFGHEAMRAGAFPGALLLFIIPIPSPLLTLLKIFLQHTSAGAAQAFFDAFSTPNLRDGLVFYLPGIPLQVAEECSGINSTIVLFIVSLIAGNLFLRTTWKRVVFTLIIIPLGILRNGFRIFTIGQLCIHIDPSMIDSPIHHRGGPIFFALSLIPLFLLLYLLRRSDIPKASTTPGNSVKDMKMAFL